MRMSSSYERPFRDPLGVKLANYGVKDEDLSTDDESRFPRNSDLEKEIWVLGEVVQGLAQNLNRRELHFISIHKVIPILP